ncbi:MAG: DUF4465 domain-containing protein [Bacteroidetes bacterium]|nr:DUF4465 domain-containing protein [Bacteroidota bacterium]
MKSLNTFFFMFASFLISAQTIADFENLNLVAGSFNNDAGNTHQFESGNVQLPNFYVDDPSFPYWSGWAVSATIDVSTPGFGNQYSAIPGSGVNGSVGYAVCYNYGHEILRLSGNAKGGLVEGLYLTNSTYAYLSMLDGDGFAKKFGGENGNDPDFFKLTIKKFLNGQLGSDSVEFYLADFRSLDNSEDYIVDDWTFVDLTPLGNVDSLQFSLSSSDVGAFGINTPTYFCLDNVTTADMPSATTEVTPSLKIETWPNPVTNFLKINWMENSNATACLSNTYGHKISNFNLTKGENNLDVSSLAAGVFTLQVTLDGRVYSKVFIKN